MAKPLQELVDLMPEQCRECLPLQSVARTLGNLQIKGLLELAQAEALFSQLVDSDCFGPTGEGHGEMCCRPDCRHSKDPDDLTGKSYLVEVNKTINLRGIEALEIQ